jgi:hypothetical protein
MPDDVAAGVLGVLERYQAAVSLNALRAFCRLGLADLLAEGPRTTDELANICALDAQLLERVATYLVADGWLQRCGDDVALTPRAAALVSSTAGSVVSMLVAPGSLDALGGLEAALRSGRAPFEEATGSAFWTWLDEHAEDDEAFVAKMGWQAHSFVTVWAGDPGWPDEGLVIDLGGGDGGLLAEVLRQRPLLRGEVVERQSVAAVAEATLARAGLGDRARVTVADFREGAPPGGDVYVLARILHDWDDATATQILRVAAIAASAGSRLRLIEMCGDGGLGALSDMTMLLLFGAARERTVDELTALLRGAGWVPTGVHRQGPSMLIDAARS